MAKVNAYMTFNGNCEEAFNFYKSVFGGEFAYVGRYKDMPSVEGQEFSEKEKENIMHMSLPISAETVLMGSDTNSISGQAVVGTNISLSVDASSNEEADKLFGGLSDGGKVAMPMANTFWGSYFGMLTDKFGINWMVSTGE